MRFGIALGNIGLAFAELPDPATHAAGALRIGTEAERLGFHSVWAGDHLVLPVVPTTPYPYARSDALIEPQTSMLDPFAILAALAGRTTRITLGFGVLVVPYRHPLISAKLIATIDAISAGRVVVGVGSGWLREEFDAVDADFESRGPTTDRYLRTMLQAFETGEVDGVTTLPRTVQRPHPPIWIGGAGPRAARRVVELGDGWDAPTSEVDVLRDGIADLHRRCEQAGRDPASVTLAVRGIPAKHIDEDLVARYETLGVGEIGAVLPVADLHRALDTMAALADRAAPHLAR